MDFVSRINKLREANPEEIISELHHMFHDITRMDGDEAIAAFQTIQTSSKLLGLENDHAISALTLAIRNRMIALVSTNAYGGDRGLRSKFGAITHIPSPDPFSRIFG